MSLLKLLFHDKDGFSITRSILVVWFVILFAMWIRANFAHEETQRTLPSGTIEITAGVVGLYWGRRNMNFGQTPGQNSPSERSES